MFSSFGIKKKKKLPKNLEKHETFNSNNKTSMWAFEIC